MRQNIDIRITYFFAHFGDTRSLKAETIQRSIIRRSFEASGTSNLPKVIENLLAKITQSSLVDINDLKTLLQAQTARTTGPFYTVIFMNGINAKRVNVTMSSMLSRRSLHLPGQT